MCAFLGGEAGHALQTRNRCITGRAITSLVAFLTCDEWLSQVLVLSEGYQLYYGPPNEAINWFSKCLGYTFWPGQQGAESDWLMDLVSVGFSKPQSLTGASMTSHSDVVKASELWQAQAQKVRALGQRVCACDSTITTETGRSPTHVQHRAQSAGYDDNACAEINLTQLYIIYVTCTRCCTFTHGKVSAGV